jgi:translation elongation factor EF-G
MSSIQSGSLTAGPSLRQSALSDSQFSSYVKKQSYSAYESLDAGLTIKTREGDLVTLSSNTYSKLDAYMYDSRGVLQTDTGTVSTALNQREITLESGESFTFSVSGNLSEEELLDIEAVVKGIDGVIAEMKAGDMDDALNAALSMGGFDTIEAYSADITHTRSYAVTTEIEATTSDMEAGATGSMENFFEKMAEKIEELDEKLVDKARDPIEDLFKHHLGKMKESSGQDTSLYSALEKAGQMIDDLMDAITENLFKDQLSTSLG